MSVNRRSNVNKVEIVQVVRVRSIVGQGDTADDPVREIVEYFDMDGVRFARLENSLSQKWLGPFGEVTAP